MSVCELPWISDIANAFVDITYAVLDKSPVVGYVGYLLVYGSVPLLFLLVFASRMKKLDNERVQAGYHHELSIAQLANKQSDAEG